MDEVKRFYTDLINMRVKDDVEKETPSKLEIPPKPVMSAEVAAYPNCL